MTVEQRLKAVHERLTLTHAIGHECVQRYKQAGGGAAGTEAMRHFLSCETPREAVAKFHELAGEMRLLELEFAAAQRKVLDANAMTWEPA